MAFKFMQDPRFPPDTLFLTFEQDFRWYERDCLTIEQWLPMCVTTNSSTPTLVPPREGYGGAARPPVTGGATSSQEKPRLTRTEVQNQNKGKVERVEQSTKATHLAPVSQEVFDLVCTCNLAHRAGFGEIVWFGYNCSDHKDTMKGAGIVGFGTQGVAFTRRSAHLMEWKMKDRKPQLFDLFLKSQLNLDYGAKPQKNFTELAKCCYIDPPCGGFYEHETEIYSPHGNVRPTLFGAKWGQEGSVGAVRPTDVPRILRKFPCWKQPGERVFPLPPFFRPDNHSLYWKTMLPPGLS